MLKKIHRPFSVWMSTFQEVSRFIRWTPFLVTLPLTLPARDQIIMIQKVATESCLKNPGLHTAPGRWRGTRKIFGGGVLLGL